MPKPKTMQDVVKALQEDGLSVRGQANIKIEGPGICNLCGHRPDFSLSCLNHWPVSSPSRVIVCPDRLACRRRQAEREEMRVELVLEKVVV